MSALLSPLFMHYVCIILVVGLQHPSLFLTNWISVLVKFNKLSYSLFGDFRRVESQFIDLAGAACGLMVDMSS